VEVVEPIGEKKVVKIGRNLQLNNNNNNNKKEKRVKLQPMLKILPKKRKK